ncbi:MAG TPA: sulfur oxidation c-type cytochrome SoxX [Burkholderiales bacterium]|nr:sulfur oxidation c-type cytochrome SoxX [Burkholderiales bacterium]
MPLEHEHRRRALHPQLVAALVFGSAFLYSTSQGRADEAPNVTAGRQLAFEIAKGNCLACHQFPRDPRANTLANIGPPLLAIRSRFPDRAQLRSRLWDPMQTNPNTAMPPFGKHRILSSDEIELIIDYLYTQ